MKKLGFGMMRLPMIDNKIDIEEVNKMVDEFMKRGFTYFDTAWPYHNFTSEDAVKRCIVDRYPRDSFTITTKLPDFEIKSFEDRDRIFNEQKRKTGCTYFDYYWLHAVNRNNIEIFDKFKCWDFIKHKKEIGEVKHIGFSFHDDAQMLEELLIKHEEIEYVQLQLNYFDYEYDKVQSRKCYEVCTKYNKPVIVMEPVRGGRLVKLPDEVEKVFKEKDDKLSNASWAIRFAASLDNVYMVLSGMSNMEQLLDNLSYMEDFKPLNKEEFDTCLWAGELIRSRSFIGCTGCRYCTENCPTSIKIPELFNLFNKAKKDDNNLLNYQKEFIDLNSEVSIDDCLDCKECERRCPQHLRITSYLKQINEYFIG